jgi:hypothetical protein
MKQVHITSPSLPITMTSAVSKSKYYGIQQKVNGCKKGFLHRERFNLGNYSIRCIDYLTEGNSWDIPEWRSSELQVTIEILIKDERGFDVYEFDTAKELFLWLAK